MISLSEVQASNAQIAKIFPPGLVAVFVGATNGIGEAALKEFALSARSPRAYFIGRSEEAAGRIKTECRQLNPEGEFIFIKADISLIRNVDLVTREIQSKEKSINLLFLSCGTLRSGKDTTEGLHTILAAAYYARTRFILNLLPELKCATHLRRVVTVLAGTHEGAIDETDFQVRKMSMLKGRGQTVSMTDFALETLAEKAPEVSFVHDYPGVVKTGITREVSSPIARVLFRVVSVIGPLVYIPIRESGERHLFFATSAVYPPRAGDAVGVKIVGGEVVRGTDGVVGSGVYSVGEKGEAAGKGAVKVLDGLRGMGMKEKVWGHTLGEFGRIVGSRGSRLRFQLSC
ncbi:uncharacterized protein N7515_006704 [Penicillium bovifimosum]|uniref:Uncharacterized protein n=1 Tax=Penicillium bovifimosum TaxID=126998 RepID=A0A9W9GV83_9EURO|nr:uncharacterized protein N7515_006704 [Penicillium bovifimosum]KAJ5130665.1 hypothetical protein N7515_006704 [Penicillium bovifimosum]